VHRDRVRVNSGPPFDQDAFNEYLRWLQRSTRLHIKGVYTDRAIKEGSEEDVVEDEYDIENRQETQPQQAPLMAYVVRISCNPLFYLTQSVLFYFKNTNCCNLLVCLGLTTNKDVQ
jgi:hypothetical protein